MRSEKNLKYSNEIPKWARFIHLCILAFIALITLIAFSMGVYLLVSDFLWGSALFMFALAAIIGWLTRFLYRVIQFQHHVRVLTQLQTGIETPHSLPAWQSAYFFISRAINTCSAIFVNAARCKAEMTR